MLHPWGWSLKRTAAALAALYGSLVWQAATRTDRHVPDQRFDLIRAALIEAGERCIQFVDTDIIAHWQPRNYSGISYCDKEDERFPGLSTGMLPEK